MDKRRIVTTAMMVLGVVVLFTGTICSIGGAASGNLFEQPPPSASEPAVLSFSTNDPTYPIDSLVYENFWGVTGNICDIHWYGSSGIPNETYPYLVHDKCDPRGMIFDITFYANNATGMPGEVVCLYENVTPKISYYRYHDYLDDYYFETDLNPCCQLRDGWVSLQSQGSDNGCWFAWLSPFSSDTGDNFSLQEDRTLNITYQKKYNLAFTLTGKAEVPALTPTGLIALLSLLSAIAAVTIVRKRR